MEIQNPDILTILEYSEPSHFKNQYIFGPCQRLRWKVLWKWSKGTIVFPKCSTLDLWQISEHTHLSISSRQLVEWPCNMHCIWDIFRTLSFNENSDMFKDIHVLFRHFQPYSGIFEPWITVIYSEPFHIQNSGIFRTWDICRTMLKHTLAYA